MAVRNLLDGEAKMIRAVIVCSLMLLGGFMYHAFISATPNFIFVAEQAYWTTITLIGLWGTGCIGSNT